MIEDGKYDFDKGIEIILREHTRRLEATIHPTFQS